MRRLCAFFLVLCAVLPCGCTHRAPLPYDALQRFAEAYPLPAGRLYDSTAPEGDDAYLPPDLFSALYARPDGTDDRADTVSYALFLGTSLQTAYEMGIFLCHDRDAANEVVGMLKTRLALLEKMDEADTAAAKTAVIRQYGKTVVYTVLPDNEKAARTLDRIF